MGNIIEKKRKLIPGFTLEVDTLFKQILSIKKGRKIIKLNHRVKINDKGGRVIQISSTLGNVSVVFDNEPDIVVFIKFQEKFDELEPIK